MSWQPPPAPPTAGWGPPPSGSSWPPPGGYGAPPGALPYPAYGATYGYPGAPGPLPGLEYARFWRRFLGYILDEVILAVPAVVIFLVVLWPSLSSYINQVNSALQSGLPRPTYSIPVHYYLLAGLVSAALGFLYWGVLVGTWGRTVGQAAAGVRVVCEEDPRQPIPMSRAIARSIVWWGASLLEVAPVLGPIAGLITLFCLLWVAWDPRKQGLHDKLGRALVVRAIPTFGASPYGMPPAWPASGTPPAATA